jgi:P27 family predicted phage terminase small subunit
MPRKGRLQVEYGFPPPKLVEPVAIELPAPPDHLSAEAQAWWRQVVADYDLDHHHLKLLEAAADAWDRMTMARAEVLADGITIPSARGTVVNPAVAVERDARAAFARLIRELDLDTPMAPPARYVPPPSLRSNRRR